MRGAPGRAARIGSLTTTCVHRRVGTTVTAIRPMARHRRWHVLPEHVEAQRRVHRVAERTEEAATSSSMPGQWCQTWPWTAPTSSAKAPSRSDGGRCFETDMASARQAVSTATTDHVAFPLTTSPTAKSLTLLPTSTTRPTNSWPTMTAWPIVRSADASNDARAGRCRRCRPWPTSMRTSLMPTLGQAPPPQLEARAGLLLHEGEHPCLSSADIDLHHPPPRLRMPATLGMRERAEPSTVGRMAHRCGRHGPRYPHRAGATA